MVSIEMAYLNNDVTNGLQISPVVKDVYKQTNQQVDQ